MKKLTILILSLMLGGFTYAQYIGSAGIAVGPGAVMGTLGVEKQFSLTKSKKLHINPGIRFNVYSGSGLDYITAPARLTADDANVDTLSLASVQNNFANLFVRFAYDVTQKLSVSFDIDLIGVSFGRQQNNLPFSGGANFRQFNPATPAIVTSASPTTLNYLIMGDLDHGSLNSTFSVTYQLNDKFALDAGFGLVFTEYTTDTELGFDNNDRFRNKNGMGYVGVQYVFGK
jgi:hypothetical protein